MDGYKQAARLEVEVLQESIRVESIDLVVDDPNAKVLCIDCSTKRYAADVATVVDDEETWFEVVLSRTEHTLRPGNSDEPTRIGVRGARGVSGDFADWACMVESARYTTYLYLWRTVGTATTPLWSAAGADQ